MESGRRSGAMSLKSRCIFLKPVTPAAASVRYLAVDLGKEGIRVNAISAGPVRTLAAAGVTGFKKMHRLFTDISPLRRPLTIDDLGNAAVYLCSDMSRGTTGEIHYVDGGYNIIGVPEVVD